MKKFNCKAPGCPNTIDEPGYCIHHQGIKKDREAEREKALADHFARLSKEGQSLFNTKEWRELRKRLLKLHPYCDICGSTEQLELHHIQKHHGNPLLFFNPSNLQVLCKQCHKGISMEQIRSKR